MPSGRAPTWVLVLALAWRRLVAGVARRQGGARADRPAGPHGLPRHAVAGHAGAASRGTRRRGRAGVARPRGVAGCLRLLGWGRATRRHALARWHGVAGPRRLPGSHVVAGWHRRWRLAAGGIWCPARTARVHPGLVTGTWWLSSGPAGRRPVLAPPARRRSRGSLVRRRRSGGPQDFRDVLASWRPGRATIPGHVDQAARRVHVRGVEHGGPAGTPSPVAPAVTAACGRGSAEPVLAVPLRCAAPR